MIFVIINKIYTELLILRNYDIVETVVPTEDWARSTRRH
jgi:hypothetical protein